MNIKTYLTELTKDFPFVSKREPGQDFKSITPNVQTHLEQYERQTRWKYFHPDQDAISPMALLGAQRQARRRG